MKKRFDSWKKPHFDKNGMTRWYWRCQHHAKLKLGRRVDIGSYTYINALYGVELKDNVQIGSHCSLYTISTIDGKKGKIIMEKGSCLGSHSVVMPGVKIGRNCTVGAFSFVNKDIPDDSLAYGVPVKIIRKLSKKESKKLRKLA